RLLQRTGRHDGLDQPPRQRGLRVVLPAEEPDLLRALLTDLTSQEPDPVAPVERPDPGAGLSESGVVRGDREVAAQVQHVAAADRVPGHHGDRWLGEAPDLDLEVEHVEPPDPLLVHVAVVPADLLVSAAAERLRARARGLIACALPPGDVWLVILAAHASSGASFFPIDVRLSDREQRAVIERARPALLVTPDDEVLFADPAPIDPDRAWAVVATSGVSGRPKLAELPRTALGAAVAGSLTALDASAFDPWVACLSPAHL